MSKPRSILMTIGLFAGLLTLLSGCGRKGDPTPVEIKVRQPLVVLQLNKTSDAVTVGWPLQEGRGQRSVFKVERSELKPEEKDCLTCPQTYADIAEIDAEGPFCRQKNPQSCLYSDGNVKKGYHYTYRVSICNETGRCERYAPVSTILY